MDIHIPYLFNIYILYIYIYTTTLLSEYLFSWNTRNHLKMLTYFPKTNSLVMVNTRSNFKNVG